MSKSERNRIAENAIEQAFPLFSDISCRELVDTNALMNAEKTLLANEVLISKGKERKLAEAKLRALAEQRKELDELYLFKKCRELEQIDIEKKQLDAIDALRSEDKSLGSKGLDNQTLFLFAGVAVVSLVLAFALRKRG